MAAFKPHYTLCPLLGAHNLVGVSADKEESAILVTLGPNIIVKHKLSDQKPLKSWSTRQSNQITCKSVFDVTSEKYVCVLNRKHICLWNEEESNLEDVKKHTFSTAIHAVHSLPGKSSIIVFENGYSEHLDVSLSKRKEAKPSLLHQGETVSKSFIETIKEQTILVLCTSNNKVYYVRLASDGTPEGNLNFSLTKGDSTTLGMAVVNDGNIVTIIVLWSNGELVQYSEQGGIMATYTLSGICLSSPVAMVMLDATHIAIYGADVNEEGAAVLLFDLKFGMSVANRRLKFFCDPPHMYCLAANNVILLCVVQNLVVVPYVLQPSLLWNLIDGQHMKDLNLKPDIVVWGGGSRKMPSNPNPLKFRKVETTKLSDSLWESNSSSGRIFDELLPLLKEDQDVDGICLLLSAIKDLPEKWQADLLNFSLEESTSCDQDKRSRILKTLLSISYSDVVLLNHLRRKLTTKSTIKLLKYLAELLTSCQWTKDEGSTSKPDLSQVVDWISLILDAHHHELLIASKDDEVKQLIKQLAELVGENYDFLNCLGESEPLVTLLEQKRRPPENRRKDWYAIEVVRLL